MMKQHSSSVDSFLAELKASLSEASGDSVLRRINAERLLRLLAEEFVQSHQADRIRVMPDNRFAGEPGADVLVQIDDYDVRLEFVDSADGPLELDAGLMPHFLKQLEENPSTVALVVVWTTDDLRSVPLTVTRIRHLSQDASRVRQLLSAAKPLPEVLREIVARQMRHWDVPWEEVPRSSVQPAGLRQLFEGAIEGAIELERDRSYRFTERKLAAERFPIDAEVRLVLAVLNDALNGAPADAMVSRLTRLPRRGVR